MLNQQPRSRYVQLPALSHSLNQALIGPASDACPMQQLYSKRVHAPRSLNTTDTTPRSQHLVLLSHAPPLNHLLALRAPRQLHIMPSDICPWHVTAPCSYQAC
mmetsp:Transcript_33436/g.84761  ORF Transcript_33436/g.84761 Transcript_33436/m.84761 type:complete len:103 (+) Transcript_33436:208-516(+)